MCCLSNVAAARHRVLDSRCGLISSRPRQVKAAQEVVVRGEGALVLALIYGERVLLLSPKILYNWLTELLLQVEGSEP